MSIMMVLGKYSFSLSTATYENFTRRFSYNWQSQNRIGNKTALQFTGYGLEQIDLEGVIYPHFRGGFNQIELLKNEADNATPLMLIDGLGRIWGKWVINSIEEISEIFFKNGIPRKISFRLSITKYD